MSGKDVHVCARACLPVSVCWDKRTGIFKQSISLQIIHETFRFRTRLASVQSFPDFFLGIPSPLIKGSRKKSVRVTQAKDEQSHVELLKVSEKK